MSKIVCSICLVAFTSTDDVCSTECGHTYHQQCERQWRRRSTDCPICRYHNPKSHKLFLSFESDGSRQSNNASGNVSYESKLKALDAAKLKFDSEYAELVKVLKEPSPNCTDNTQPNESKKLVFVGVSASIRRYVLNDIVLQLAALMQVELDKEDIRSVNIVENKNYPYINGKINLLVEFFELSDANLLLSNKHRLVNLPSQFAGVTLEVFRKMEPPTTNQVNLEKYANDMLMPWGYKKSFVQNGILYVKQSNRSPKIAIYNISDVDNLVAQERNYNDDDDDDVDDDSDDPWGYY